MKKVIILSTFILGSLMSYGQTLIPEIIGHIGNNSCITAKRMCSPVTQTIHLGDGTTCDAESFYYVVQFDATYNHAADLQISGTGGTWEWSGAFNSFGLDECNLIETLAAPSLSGTITAGTGLVELDCLPGFYVLKVTPFDCYSTITVGIGGNDIGLICIDEIPCEDCITSFSPTPGKYIVSAWVKEEGASPTTLSYSNVSIDISFPGATPLLPLLPTGKIIDGWQRIESEIEVPIGATAIDIQLTVSSGSALFDDVRFFPFDGSMMSYVYDPQSLRLMAELDERNYATLYEYDEEGKLIRVKKETEKGVMTIQENRDNIKK
jgi:hypothetical protein